MLPLRSVPPSVVPGGVTVIWNLSFLPGSPLSCTVTENVQGVPLMVPLPLKLAVLPVMANVVNVALLTFAPVAWLFSQSTESVNWMGTLHLIFWFIAAIFGLRFVDTAFSHSQAKSNAGFNTWVVIFMLVVVQMTTALRPIVGTSESFFPKEKKFFLSYWADCLKPGSERSRPETTR